MEEIKIYENPLSKEEFTKHSINGNITNSRSEEHTSELQSHSDLVCRLLLEKKKQNTSSSLAKCLYNNDTAHTIRPR